MQGIEKIKLIQQMLLAELHPLFSDLDVVWLRNPLPYVRHLLDANVLASSDSCQPVNDVMLDDCPSLLPSSRDVVGTTYVGFMNVSTLPVQLQLHLHSLKAGFAVLEQVSSSGRPSCCSASTPNLANKSSCAKHQYIMPVEFVKKCLYASKQA